MGKLTFLGTGTSTGVPLIGCDCPVCQSTNIKDKRLRSSIWVESGSASLLVDTSTDFRTQALNAGIKSLDAVFYTHHHADHIHGIDDLRSFNFIGQGRIPCYGSSGTLRNIQTMFHYIFDGLPETGGGKPKLSLHSIDAPVVVKDMPVEPVRIMHGELPIFGYIFNKTAYLTDCSAIPEESMERLYGMDTIILGALGLKSHPTHFTVEQALEMLQELKPKQGFLTHLNHVVGHDEVSGRLPGNVYLAYDGLTIPI